MSKATDELRRASTELRKLGMGARNVMAVATKKQINELLEEQFDRGIGPDGRPWKALAASTRRRGRTPPPLTDTRKMRDHTKAVVVGTNVGIDAPFPAQAHQKGGRYLPQRRIWPTGSQAPARYVVALGKEITRALLAYAKKTAPTFKSP